MKVPSKLTFKATIFGLITICAHADEKRTYQAGSLGNIQYNKPSYNIEKYIISLSFPAIPPSFFAFHGFL
jgi:hypothetical protein